MIIQMQLLYLLAVKQNVDGKDTQYGVFKVGVFVHQNRDHSDVGEEASRSSDDVLFRKPKLSGRVETSVVH